MDHSPFHYLLCPGRCTSMCKSRLLISEAVKPLLWELQGPSPPQLSEDRQDTRGKEQPEKIWSRAVVQKSEISVRRKQQLCANNSVYTPCSPGKESKTNCAQPRWSPHWRNWWAMALGGQRGGSGCPESWLVWSLFCFGSVAAGLCDLAKQRPKRDDQCGILLPSLYFLCWHQSCLCNSWLYSS